MEFQLFKIEYCLSVHPNAYSYAYIHNEHELTYTYTHTLSPSLFPSFSLSQYIYIFHASFIALQDPQDGRVPETVSRRQVGGEPS